MGEDIKVEVATWGAEEEDKEDQVALVMVLADLTVVTDVRDPLTASMELDTGKEIVQLPSNVSSVTAHITWPNVHSSTKRSTNTCFITVGIPREPV